MPLAELAPPLTLSLAVPSEAPSQVVCAPIAGGTILRVSWSPPPRYSDSKMISNYRVYYRELALPDSVLGQLDRPLAGADAALVLQEHDEQNESAARYLNVSSEKPNHETSIYVNELKAYTAYVIQVLSTTAFGLGARSSPLLCRTFKSSAPFSIACVDLTCLSPDPMHEIRPSRRARDAALVAANANWTQRAARLLGATGSGQRAHRALSCDHLVQVGEH